ncbi:MAG: hypothetical protein E6J20_16620 [Chloroflexi bacterium]|nr:MAG: hypothetical protein E6J20_16620 [Chloroflexota bacterium]
MNQAIVLTLFIAVAIVLIAITVVLARTVGKSRLRGLPEESRNRYASSWHSVETRFIDDPSAAVQEADKVVVMILSERGANLTDEKRMPKDLREARTAASMDHGQRDTEAMRRAMVHYKKMVDDAVGTASTRREGYRREMA